MTTLVTPSAKSHERVTGRWVRDLVADSKRDWIIYYAKLVFGSPIPWLFGLFLCALFISRPAVEVTAWATGLLTIGYVTADRFARDREFEFFRIGSDFMLVGFVLVGIVGLLTAQASTDDWLSGLLSLRWVLLVYLFAWCWQLFPGLNRMYRVLYFMAALTCGYTIYQHFGGVDAWRGWEQLPFAPVKEHAYHVVTGFFRSPEILATVLATLLPIPAAAFMLADKREAVGMQVVTMLLVLLLSVAIFWTYKPGFWMAGGVGLGVAVLMQSRRKFIFILFVGVFLASMLTMTYSSAQSLLDQIKAKETTRGEQQRAQINKHIQIWQENTILGAGTKDDQMNPADNGSDTLNDNVYFQLLARSGALGLAFYLLFTASFLLSIYRVSRDIPQAHYWHRVLTSGGIGGLAAFHVAGLYWSTLTDSHATCTFVFLLSSLAYLREHYDSGLVPDDQSL